MCPTSVLCVASVPTLKMLLKKIFYLIIKCVSYLRLLASGTTQSIMNRDIDFCWSDITLGTNNLLILSKMLLKKIFYPITKCVSYLRLMASGTTLKLFPVLLPNNQESFIKLGSWSLERHLLLFISSFAIFL